MNLNWTEWNELENTYFKDESWHKIHYIKIVTQYLINNYPKPLDWFNTPIEDISYIKANSTTDLYYIICWAWEHKLYTNPTYSDLLLDYFLDERHNGSRAPIWFAQKVNLITKKELQIINKYKKGIAKLICIHCIFLSKPFKDFTNADVFKIPALFNRKCYKTFSIHNIRMILNYSNIVVQRLGPQTNWARLFNVPLLGYTYKEFYEYLIRCDARKSYMINAGMILRRLFDYMNENDITSFVFFNSQEFKKLTDHFRETLKDSSTLGYIGLIKRFLEWGVGTSPLFSDRLDYPSLYWKQLLRKTKEQRKNSDGHAFSEPKLAEQIVKIIYSYLPKNDLEFLCRSFWLLLSCCPARFSYILNIGAEGALQPLPNDPDAYGIYSSLSDKAGNKYGQFPILDKIGIEVILSLQARVNRLELKSIKNPLNNKTYLHLFQLTEYPWILDKNTIRTFFDKIVKSELSSIYEDLSRIQMHAHGFRHHLLTHIAYVTGDISAVQTASGHQNEEMTREYLRSKVSRNTLLFRVIKKYETNEITGKFYLRLVELLSSEEAPVDEMLRALTTEMRLDEFLSAYGRKSEMGYCFSKNDCSNWLKCWDCTNFMMTKEEISSAIRTLSVQIMNLREMQLNSSDFSYTNPIVHRQVKIISLIVKRLTELCLFEDDIIRMVDNFLHDIPIEKGVVANESKLS
jgi:integrase